MSKLLGILLAGLCATAAFAQGDRHQGDHDRPNAAATIGDRGGDHSAMADRDQRGPDMRRGDDHAFGKDRDDRIARADRDDRRVARADRDDRRFADRDMERARYRRFDRDDRHYASRDRDDHRFARWERSNRGGYLRGEERSEHVHMLNALQHVRHHRTHVAWRHHAEHVASR